MMAPPIPTTTPITVLRVSGDMPVCALLPLLANPGVCVVVSSLVIVVDCPLTPVVVMNVVLVSMISEVELPEVLGGGVIEAEGLVVPDCVVELDDWLDDEDRLVEGVVVGVGGVVGDVGGVEDGAGGAVVDDDDDEVELEPVPLS